MSAPGYEALTVRRDELLAELEQLNRTVADAKTRLPVVRGELATVRRALLPFGFGPPATPRTCRVCGASYVRKGRALTCAEHTWVWLALRLHLPVEREKHRTLVARRTAAKPRNETERRSAERQLAGAAGTHGRWLVRGSVPMVAARLAYENRWPIFKELPEEIQRQIEEDEEAPS